jgi:hypothetical protein
LFASDKGINLPKNLCPQVQELSNSRISWTLLAREWDSGVK